MKFVTEFRNPEKVNALKAHIKQRVIPGKQYRFMEFCGGHTHAIFKFGIPDLLPDSVQLIHGPGCPVCVLPISHIQTAIQLARQPDTILCSFGDMLRVPGAKGVSLLHIKAEGCDVRMIQSPLDCLTIAQNNPHKTVVLFAIGFETTAPGTAAALVTAESMTLTNFKVFCNHVLSPPAIQHILDSPEVREIGTVRIDGFLGPAHVSAVIGSEPFEFFVEEYQRPVVISGFEPLDVLQTIAMLIEQVNTGRLHVGNQYSRVVQPEGNEKAQALVQRVFELKSQMEWRGLGLIPYSGLKIRPGYQHLDAELHYQLPPIEPIEENKACLCGKILRGLYEPTDCPLFGTGCTPEHPVGSCMVSSEGTCAAVYQYGRRAVFAKKER